MLGPFNNNGDMMEGIVDYGQLFSQPIPKGSLYFVDPSDLVR